MLIHSIPDTLHWTVLDRVGLCGSPCRLIEWEGELNCRGHSGSGHCVWLRVLETAWEWRYARVRMWLDIPKDSVLTLVGGHATFVGPHPSQKIPSRRWHMVMETVDIDGYKTPPHSWAAYRSGSWWSVGLWGEACYAKYQLYLHLKRLESSRCHLHAGSKKKEERYLETCNSDCLLLLNTYLLGTTYILKVYIWIYPQLCTRKLAITQ